MKSVRGMDGKMFKKIIYMFTSILCVCFIFFNSSQDGAKSHGRSYYIVSKIVDTLDTEKIYDTNKYRYDRKSNRYSIYLFNKTNEFRKLNIRYRLIKKIRNIGFIKNIDKGKLEYLVRKFAHGFEFGLLGLSLCLFFSSFNINRYNVIIYALFLVLFTAVIDETIQIKIPTRTSSTIDVLIDFCGGSISCIIFYISEGIFMKFKSKRNKISKDINVIEYKKIQS